MIKKSNREWIKEILVLAVMMIIYSIIFPSIAPAPPPPPPPPPPPSVPVGGILAQAASGFSIVAYAAWKIFKKK